MENNNNIKSINDFSFKSKIKGKIGTFSFKERKVTQELKIYRAANNKFTKYSVPKYKTIIIKIDIFKTNEFI